MHVPLPKYDTENVASMYPFAGRKKSWMPRRACSMLSDAALVGLFDTSPIAVEVKVCVTSFTYTVEVTVSPVLGRSGAT